MMCASLQNDHLIRHLWTNHYWISNFNCMPPFSKLTRPLASAWIRVELRRKYSIVISTLSFNYRHGESTIFLVEICFELWISKIVMFSRVDCRLASWNNIDYWLRKSWLIFRRSTWKCGTRPVMQIFRINTFENCIFSQFHCTVASDRCPTKTLTTSNFADCITTHDEHIPRANAISQKHWPQFNLKVIPLIKRTRHAAPHQLQTNSSFLSLSLHLRLSRSPRCVQFRHKSMTPRIDQKPGSNIMLI